MSAELTLEGLTYAHGDGRAAVDGLSLTARPGELLALLGPSGCGKTTTLELISGLRAPQSGTIRLDGASLAGVAPERRGMGVVFQQDRLFEHMSVADNVGFGLRMRGVPRLRRAQAVRQALDQVYMAALAGRRPLALSGGERQRVALARALVTEPRVMLLDEPLSALDAGLREEMRELVHRLQRDSGRTMVFVTHDQQEAVRLADRIALVFDGRLEMLDTPEAFYARPATRRAAAFFGAVNFLPGEADAGWAQTPLGRLRIGCPAARGACTLTVRPEAVRLGGGDNAFTARVTEAAYRGTHVRYTLQHNGCGVVAELPPDTGWSPGELTEVRLPAAALWPLPAGETGAIASNDKERA